MTFFELFVARRFTFEARRPFSKLIVRIAIAGIALGLAVMICSVAIMTGFKGTIRDKVRGFSGDLEITRLNLNESYENDPFAYTHALALKISALGDVKSVSAFANKAGILSSAGEIEGVVLKGLSSNYDSGFIRDKLIEGSQLNLMTDTASFDILVPKVIASRLKLHTGQHVLMYFIQKPMRTRKLFIKGIYDLGMDELDKTYVLGDIRLIRRLNDWPDSLSGGVQIGLKDFGTLERSQEKVNHLLPVQLKTYNVRELFPQLFDWLSLTDVNVQVILVLMLLVAGINMISALLIMILERTSTIGIFKALGSTDLSIRLIFIGVAAYLIALGLILGNLIGLGFCFLQSHYRFVKLNEQTYYMSYVPIKISWLSILEINAGTLIACLLMLIVPSFLISRINPIKAIRFK